MVSCMTVYMYLKGIMSMCIKTLGPSLRHSTEVVPFEFKMELIQLVWNTLYYCKANIYFAFHENFYINLCHYFSEQEHSKQKIRIYVINTWMKL